MKRIIIAALFLALVLSFAGCAPRTESVTNDVQLIENDFDIEYGSDRTNLTMSMSGNGIMFTIIGSNENGTYGVDKFTSGGAKIVYYDHDTMTYGYLEADKDALEDCTWLEEVDGGISPVVTEENVFWFKSGDVTVSTEDGYYDEGSGSYIMRMDLNGSNRVQLRTTDTERINYLSGMAFDGRDFYFMRLDYDGKTEIPVSESVCKTDFDSQEIKTLGQFDGSFVSLSIVGVYDAGLVLLEVSIPPEKVDENGYYSDNDLEYRVLLYNVNTCKTQYTKLNWKQWDMTFVVGEDNNAYICSMTDGKLYKYNLVTDEKDELDVSFDAFVFDYASIVEMHDNHVLMSLYDEESGNEILIGVDVISGEVVPIDLWYVDSDGIEYRVTICSENKNAFIVMCGADYVETTDRLEDGTTYSYEKRIERFGIISKEDFWNSCNSICTFRESVDGMSAV